MFSWYSKKQTAYDDDDDIAEYILYKNVNVAYTYMQIISYKCL